MPIPEKFVDRSITDLHVLVQLEKDVGIEVVAKLITLFVDELTTMKDEIQSAIDNKDTVKVKEITHVLKNSAALYGAVPLAALASELHDSPPATIAKNLDLALIILHELNKAHNAYQAIINNIAM